MLKGGLKSAVKNIYPVYSQLDESNIIKMYFKDVEIGRPIINLTNLSSSAIYPNECRLRGICYSAPLKITIGWSLNGEERKDIHKVIASVPMMVQSLNCSLKYLSPKDLVKAKEDPNEWGGYFILNGIEKLLRLLILQRRNYPIALIKQSWKNKLPLMSEFGVNIRCVDNFGRNSLNVLHFMQDGHYLLSFMLNKQTFYIPVILLLKAFVNLTDIQIFQILKKINPTDSFYVDSIKDMLLSLKALDIFTQKQAMNYIGELFRPKVLRFHKDISSLTVCEYIFTECILVHNNNHKNPNHVKFNLLHYMIKKMQSLINGSIVDESVDVLSNHEILLPGQIYQLALVDKLEQWLFYLRSRMIKTFQSSRNDSIDVSEQFINNCSNHCPKISQQMENFLKTGNLVTKRFIGVSQTSGLSIISERLNFMRYISHFRCVHRGSFFTTSYTTSVRKLLPECWGFICPVHTPDGAPCGLMNHFASNCLISTDFESVTCFEEILKGMGVVSMEIPSGNTEPPLLLETFTDYQEMVPVIIDGFIYGYCPRDSSRMVTYQLRKFKFNKKLTTEIVYIAPNEDNVNTSLPCIFIFSTPSRLMRPVFNAEHGGVEYIGTFEQIFMSIAISEEEFFKSNLYEYYEINAKNVFSEAAIIIPFSDHNQSPRNMYQCQMSKQSLGTPCLSINHRFDNKIYHLLQTQSPICKNRDYDEYDLDNYPQGLNAVVAVISYTGYDMEDALIINQAALDRGFAFACVYKSFIVDLSEKKGMDYNKSVSNFRFGTKVDDPAYKNGFIDIDGLPCVGRLVSMGEALYSYYDVITNVYKIVLYKNLEKCYIDSVVILSSPYGPTELTKVNIKTRIPRNPVVGDKFASRHGQKGILSIKWAAEDMPFSENGMIPDIIFNPHGFPSRMTIGMMIELMAGKAGSTEAQIYDSSPFNKERRYLKNNKTEGKMYQGEGEATADYFAKILQELGYNYYSTETLYSGTTGVEMEAKIFMGIVYYQRLRHMVSDKFQVRSIGSVDALTNQPVGGRKRGGGVRFGEMERDALISHGSSFLLQERLFHSSDGELAYVCKKCGDILTIEIKNFCYLQSLQSKEKSIETQHFKNFKQTSKQNIKKPSCIICQNSDQISCINLPHVFKYLIAELAAMNIKVKLDFNNRLL